MTSLKNYRLGCGESLQSNWLELERMAKLRDATKDKPKVNMMPKSKQGKKH